MGRTLIPSTSICLALCLRAMLKRDSLESRKLINSDSKNQREMWGLVWGSKENATTIYSILRGWAAHIFLGVPCTCLAALASSSENMACVKAKWCHVELVGRFLEDTMCQYVVVGMKVGPNPYRFTGTRKTRKPKLTDYKNREPDQHSGT